jgi:hypothetical protein
VLSALTSRARVLIQLEPLNRPRSDKPSLQFNYSPNASAALVCSVPNALSVLFVRMRLDGDVLVVGSYNLYEWQKMW